MLALVDISSRYHVGKVLEEAQEVYEPTVAPKDFDMIEIPFAERATPNSGPTGPVNVARPAAPAEQSRSPRKVSRRSAH